MLSKEQFEEVSVKLNLGPVTREVIDQVRSSPPQRRVQGMVGNVVTRYPSRKMGMTIQAESHRVELAAVLWMEHDEAVLEYYDQPPSIKLNYVSKSGKAVGVLHTPDFFVIRREWIGWEEWKAEGQLSRLTDAMPQRYVQHEGDQWRCPPGEAYAQSVGLHYRMRSSREIDWTFQRNIQFLEDYWCGEALTISSRLASDLARLVASQTGIVLAEMLTQARAEGCDADVVYALIAQGRLYVDLSKAPLAEPERVHVFNDAAIGRAYSVATDLTHSQGVSPTAQKPLTAEAVYLQEQLNSASPAALQEAVRRYHIIQSQMQQKGQGNNQAANPTTVSVSERTLRNWRAAYEAAEKAYGNGFVGLLPQTARCGNHTRKLPVSVITLMETVIVQHIETPKNKSLSAAYGELVLACKEQTLTPPSYKTFAVAVAHRPKVQQINARAGKRVAYQHQTFYWELEQTTPRHGDRPFEIAHVDHTELDIELVCSQTRRALGRPWLTLLVDAYSRRALAVSVSYEHPSYRSCMLILRECVRRHGRFPQSIVVDCGAEFESMYFEALLAQYVCSKQSRPSAQPRFGSVCERLFGTANTTFLYNLLGNRQAARNSRQVTPSVNPVTQAVWTLAQFNERLCEWAYEVYDTLDHPALGQSPRAAFTQGLEQAGGRTHRTIPYDDAFVMATLPTTRKGTAHVRGNRGIQVNRIAYWAEAFGAADVEGTQVPVRYDPFNAGIAYAYVKQHWVRCISEHYAEFKERSQREMALVTEELQRRQRLHGQHFSATAAQLAAFIRSAESTEVILKQRSQDVEYGKTICGATGASSPESRELVHVETQIRLSEDFDAQETLAAYEDY